MKSLSEDREDIRKATEKLDRETNFDPCLSQYRLFDFICRPMNEPDVLLPCLLSVHSSEHKHFFSMPDQPGRFWFWTDEEAVKRD